MCVTRATLAANKRSNDKLLMTDGDISVEGEESAGRGGGGGPGGGVLAGDPLSFISDLREYDVPYTMRCSIDMNLRVGAWFIVTPEQVHVRVCRRYVYVVSMFLW